MVEECAVYSRLVENSDGDRAGKLWLQVRGGAVSEDRVGQK